MDDDKQEEKQEFGISPLRARNDYGQNFLDRLKDGQMKIARIANSILAESDK